MAKSSNKSSDIERSLLRLLFSQKVIARSYFGKVKCEWFTSDERKFLFNLGITKFKKSKTRLTGKIVFREINAKIDDSEKTYYESEWGFVENIVVNESPDVLIDMMKEDFLGRQTGDILEETVELLEKGEIEEAVSLLKQRTIRLDTEHETKPVSDFVYHLPRKRVIRDKQKYPEKYLGLKTGFRMFDKLVGGLFKDELTIFAAITGVGKSTILKQIAKGVLFNNHGKNILHVTNEESQAQVEMKYDALLSEIPYKEFKRATISDADIDKWEKNTIDELKKVKYGKIFIKEIPAFSTILEIENVYRELEQKGIKIDLIVLDYLGRLKPVEKAWSENDEQSKAAADIKELTRVFNIPIVTADQAATVVDKKQEKGGSAGNLDIYGSKGKIHHANTFVIIMRVSKDETQTERDEWERDWFWSVSIKKNRDGPAFSFDARHHVITGKVEQLTKTESTDRNKPPTKTESTEKGKPPEEDEEPQGGKKKLKTKQEKSNPESLKEINEEVAEDDKKEEEKKENTVNEQPKPKKKVNIIPKSQ